MLLAVVFNLNLGADEFQIFNAKPTLNQNSSNAQIKVSQRLLVTSGKSAQINNLNRKNMVEANEQLSYESDYDSEEPKQEEEEIQIITTPVK